MIGIASVSISKLPTAVATAVTEPRPSVSESRPYAGTALPEIARLRRNHLRPRVPSETRRQRSWCHAPNPLEGTHYQTDPRGCSKAVAGARRSE